MHPKTQYKDNSILNSILGPKIEDATHDGSRPDVARAAGFEPTTYGLEDRCSIH
jgi:hypothetical protein